MSLRSNPSTSSGRALVVSLSNHTSHISMNNSKFFFCLLLLLTNYAHSQAYGGNFDTALAEMGNPETTTFYITKLTFNCDIPHDNKEFLYLTGLKTNSFVTKKSILRAQDALLSKKRFSSIDINMENYESGKHIIFTLKAHWILKDIKCEGIWFGKPTYVALYLQQPGDVFDPSLHDESIKSMQQSLHDQGFFLCKVKGLIRRSEKNKTVSTRIKIKTGKRFFVQNLLIKVSDLKKQKKLKQNNDVADIVEHIRSKLHARVFELFYSKEYATKLIKRCKKILTDEGFAWATITLSKTLHNKKPFIDLTFTITLGKRKIITAQGNTIFSEDYIDREIMNSDLPDWVFSSELLAQQLLHEYAKKGYWHARVKPKRKGDVGFHFDITEGEPVIIEKVNIVNATTHMPEKSTNFVHSMLTGKHADQDLLDNALEQLKRFYVTNGFWDFSIIDQTFDKNPKTKTSTLTISIDKGLQRLWGGLGIEGFKDIESHDFFKKYKKPPKGHSLPFNLQWIEEQRLFLINLFQKRGNWYATIEPELLTTHPSTGSGRAQNSTVTIFVNWKIEHGPEVKFGKAVLRGVTTIPFHRLQKQFKFTTGEPWSREKLDLTRKKLKQLDVFKTVQVQPHQLAKNKSKKPVIITVVDDDPVELRARAGYFITSRNFLFRPETTPKVGASFIVKNPTNRADRILMEADWSNFERKATIDYRQPSPFGMRATGNLRGFANKYIHPVEILQSGSAYEASEIGFLMGLHDEYKRDYHWRVNFGNEWLKTTRVRGNLNFDKNLIDVTLPYFFTEPSITIDKLDDHANTTKGLLTNVGIKFMVPENHGEIIAKINAEQSLFYPVHEKIILAGRVRLGHILGRRFDNIMPAERFYLGGPYSVRGYELEALPPLGVSQRIVNGKIINDYTIQGGNSMVNANLELRFNIYKAFGFVLFQDIGMLSQTGVLGFKDSWYPGSGFGFRYKTPIGSIRFDIGWKTKRRLAGDTSKYAWYLTLGEAF